MSFSPIYRNLHPSAHRSTHIYILIIKQIFKKRRWFQNHPQFYTSVIVPNLQILIQRHILLTEYKQKLSAIKNLKPCLSQIAPTQNIKWACLTSQHINTKSFSFLKKKLGVGGKLARILASNAMWLLASIWLCPLGRLISKVLPEESNKSSKWDQLPANVGEESGRADTTSLRHMPRMTWKFKKLQSSVWSSQLL